MSCNAKKSFVRLTLLFIVFSYLFLDKPIAYYFIKHAQEYDSLGTFLSIFGESTWELTIAPLGFLFFRYYKKNELYAQRFLFLLYANLFSGMLSVILKNLFARMRPWGLQDGTNEYGFLLFQNFDMGLVEKFKYQIHILMGEATPHISFPSGHATTLFTAAVYMYILFPKQWFLWFMSASVFSTARIMANDHFLSDVVAGALLGTLSTLFIYSKMKEKIT